jgi:hypothetical protein
VQSQYSAYGNGSHASGTDVGWYGASVPGSAGQGQPGPGLQQAPNGYQQGHYPSYQAGQPEAGAYAQPAYPGGQHDQRGYTGQDAGYGADGYQPYPGGYGTGSY